MGQDKMKKTAFLKRLEASADAVGIPPLNKGRYENIAKHLGVSHTTVRNWFTGRCLPRYDRIGALATLLQVDPVWLMVSLWDKKQ
jgi:transcriptional regulator with XRE-family HTH domain